MKTEHSLIWDFLAERNVFTLATASGGQPYCTPCFYAFDPIGKRLVFKSNMETRHIKELTLEPRVAGSILPEQLAIGQVKGIQFTGNCVQLEEKEKGALKQRYYEKYPIALATDGELWTVTLHFIKLTDSRLGFGKKVRWKRELR